MIYVGADVRDDRRDFRATIGLAAVDHKHPDRLVEFTDALDRQIKLQLGAKRGSVEAVADFVVGEIGPLRRAPDDDVGILRPGGARHSRGR